MAIILPFPAGQTWAEHFTSRGWSSPADQIAAGYPYFAQPSPAGGGEYTEEWDMGGIVTAAEVTINYAMTTITGSPSVTTTIATRATTGDAWTTVSGASVFAVSFRYVKASIALAENGALASIDSLGITCNAQKRTDSFRVMADASDVDGTTAYFTADFLKVEAIHLTAAGNDAASTSYVFDFATLSPTSFKLFLWNGATRASGEVSCTIEGY